MKILNSESFSQNEKFLENITKTGKIGKVDKMNILHEISKVFPLRTLENYSNIPVDGEARGRMDGK